MTIHGRTLELLQDPIGLAFQELQALRVEPIHLLPDLPDGFGLVGSTGCGKTWALAQDIGMKVNRVVSGYSDPNAATMPFRVRWVNWPERAEQIKREILDTRSLGDWIGSIKDCRYLYLDDLGRERSTGENDYSLGVLSEILDHRYRRNLPIFWTSNRSQDELGLFYSGRIASRLLGTWPAFEIAGIDLRLFDKVNQ